MAIAVARFFDLANRLQPNRVRVGWHYAIRSLSEPGLPSLGCRVKRAVAKASSAGKH